MRPLLVLLAAIPAFAQVAARPPAPTAAAVAPSPAPIVPGQPRPAAAKPGAVKIPLSSFVYIERTFDARLAGMSADNAGSVDLLGATRGIYLEGYGVVFTTELGLVQTPTINPFNTTITEAQKQRVHSAKITRLPTLRKAVLEAVKNIAVTLNQVPDDQQIVLAVRLDYSSWEKTAGLPGLILAKADRRDALAGNIGIEEQ